MFVANVLTVWQEAFKALFADPAYPAPGATGTPVLKGREPLLDFPVEEVDYPALWLNFTMQGDVKNVGIGHVEHINDPGDPEDPEDLGGIREVYRWHFGGLVEITVGAMGNLERALMLDELTTAIAVARVDKNYQGTLREHIERNDLLGFIVTWESFTISGFAESEGTPWGTDDVIYEATATLMIEGEVVLDPGTGLLVPLSKIIVTPQRDDEGPLPVAGTDGWL
jgi:hypothetical protein